MTSLSRRHAAPHRLRAFLACLSVGMATCGSCHAQTLDPPQSVSLRDTLVAQSQALLDALSRGDKATWQRVLDDRGLFCDEDGVVHTKNELIAQIEPLPDGFSGRIQMANAKFGFAGEFAIVSFDALESEKVFDQELATRYHTTDMYAHQGPVWRLVGSHTSVIPAQAKAIGTSPSLAEFVGNYKLGPTESVSIRIVDGKLAATNGNREELLIALGGDHFGRPGRPRSERIFIRDSSGAVTSYTDRRDNVDLIWRRQVP